MVLPNLVQSVVVCKLPHQIDDYYYDTEHEVIYREEESVYQFDLLEDLMKGDLEIIF